MRKTMMILAAAALALPASVALPGLGGEAVAKERQRYSNSAQYRRCRKSSGTAGLIAGGAAGAVVGSKVIGGGLLGTAAGAVGGAFAGRAIDRTITAKKRCN